MEYNRNNGKYRMGYKDGYKDRLIVDSVIYN